MKIQVKRLMNSMNLLTSLPWLLVAGKVNYNLLTVKGSQLCGQYADFFKLKFFRKTLQGLHMWYEVLLKYKYVIIINCCLPANVVPYVQWCC